jgi:hypothetical protein
MPTNEPPVLEAPNTRPFWIDPVIAACLLGQGLNLVFSNQQFLGEPSWPYGLALSGAGVIWLWYHRSEHVAMRTERRVSNPLVLCLVVVATIITIYDIYDRHTYSQSNERPLTKNNARLDVVAEKLVKNDPPLDANYPPNAMCAEFGWVNHSDVVAKGGVLFGMPLGPGPTRPGDGELDLFFRVIMQTQLPPQSEIDFSSNEIQPQINAHNHMCVWPDIYNATMAGKGYLVFPLVLLWRDDSMSANEVGVTEICSFLQGPATVLNGCEGHNRSYVLERSPGDKGGPFERD